MGFEVVRKSTFQFIYAKLLRCKKLKTGGNNQINAKQTITPSWALKLLGYKKTDVVAPNNLYNAALKAKNAKRVKGPANVQAKPYLEYFGKN